MPLPVFRFGCQYPFGCGQSVLLSTRDGFDRHEAETRYGPGTLFIAEMLFSARSSTSQTKNQAGQFLDPGRRLSL